MVPLPDPNGPHHWSPPERSYCNNCRGHRTHNILHAHETRWRDEQGEGHVVWGEDAYYLVQCAGCNRIHMRHDSRHSEDEDNEGQAIRRVEYSPPAYARRRPDWLTDYRGPFAFREHPVGELLEEVYVALQNGLPRVAAMGIRAALEHLMIEAIGSDKGSFGANADAFFELGLVAANDKDLFKKVLIEVGNAAIHRAHKPTGRDLEIVMDVVEQIVHATYVRPLRLASLSPIAPRKGRAT